MHNVLWCFGVAGAFALGIILGAVLSRQRVTVKAGDVTISAMSTSEVLRLLQQLRKPGKDEAPAAAPAEVPFKWPNGPCG